LRIDPSKFDIIVNWPEPKSVIEVLELLRCSPVLEEIHFKLLFYCSSFPCLNQCEEHFSVRRKATKDFRHFERKISTAPVLALSNLQRPFETETDAKGDAMDAILIQYCKPISYHSENFNQVVVNSPTYDKELYALVQSVKKWKHYLLGKETIIHTDHQPLQYLQAQSRLQQSRHYRWMGFLQQFHLVIKYKKVTSNKVVDLLYRPLIVASIILKIASLSHDSYVKQYVVDEYFKKVFEKLTHGAQVENYCLQGKLLYHLGNLCIPTSEIPCNTRSSHFSCVWAFWGRKNYGSSAEIFLLASDESDCN
jgi:hypothetical protein